MNLGTNDIAIKLADNPKEAPLYTGAKYEAANLKEAVIVGQGTRDGNPTVDLVFEDKHGQRYVAMITGAILEGVTNAVAGMRERTKGK